MGAEQSEEHKGLSQIWGSGVAGLAGRALQGWAGGLQQQLLVVVALCGSGSREGPG